LEEEMCKANFMFDIPLKYQSMNTRGTVSDVMVLNDIIEQAAGRQSRSSEKAGI